MDIKLQRWHCPSDNIPVHSIYKGPNIINSEHTFPTSIAKYQVVAS